MSPLAAPTPASMPVGRSFQIAEKAHFHRLSGGLRRRISGGAIHAVPDDGRYSGIQFISPIFIAYSVYLQFTEPY
jgi:hypothetical protein